MDFIHIAEILLTLIIGFSLSMIVLPKISLISFKKRLFDKVDSRKIHTAPIPRLGGVAFFPCVIITVLFIIVCDNLWRGCNMLDLNMTIQLCALLCCLIILYLMGITDDLIGLRYRFKFVIQILCGFLVVLSGLYFDNLYGLFGINDIPYYIGMPFTVLIVVFILNAINMIDGIDGLASGLGIIAFFFFGYMFIRLHWWLYAFLSFASFSVLLPFFYYNVYGKASRGRKIFMGDTGSLTIGLLLAVMAVRLSMSDPIKEHIFPGAIVVVFSSLIVPMLDVIRVVIHRLRNGQSPFLPDRNHIHHKFIDLGMSQRQAMVCIVGIALAFAAMNIFLMYYLSTTLLFLLDVAIWTVMHCYITVKINRKRKCTGKV